MHQGKQIRIVKITFSNTFDNFRLFTFVPVLARKLYGETRISSFEGNSRKSFDISEGLNYTVKVI